MLIGVLLVITWLILLIRYPLKAAPISLGAALGLALVAAWAVWQGHREEQRLARLELRLTYAPALCPGNQPLHTHLHNHNEQPLQSLRWEIAAYAPGAQINLVEAGLDAPRYRGPGDLQAGEQWQVCLPLPPLRPGYRPETLQFRAERLRGHFAD